MIKLEAKGLETINIGYVGFGIVRMQIASTVSWKLGIAYRSLYSKEGMTTKVKKYIRNNFDETLVNFLFHSDCDGKMTPKECFNTQGFPEYFVLPDIADGRLYKQAGNSVCVSVVQRIAEQMLVAMK